MRVGLIALVLLLVAVSAAPGPGRTAGPLRSDWEAGAARGDRDEIAPPLTAAQVTHAIEQAATPRRI